MKRVLIITYYWPPTGGSGVQRWVKFSKYLPDYGWQPVIYTPENPERIAVDDSLLADIPSCAEILRTPIKEPYAAYRRIHGDKEVNPINSGKKSFAQKLAVWVRGNFFIPDPRVSWVRPSVTFLKKYLKEHPVDAIVTTGPPHSMHLIGRELKMQTGVRWIADFRDPWTRMFFFKHLGLGPFAKKRHRNLELSVLGTADAVISVSPPVRDEFQRDTMTTVHLITNGFDPDDFASAAPRRTDGEFRIVHTGLFAADGNPVALWKALASKCADDPSFASALRIRLAGKTDRQITDAIRGCGLAASLDDLGYLPHEKTVIEQKSADMLILPLRQEPEYAAVLPGKIFEYLAARRPVLGIGQEDGAASAVLSDAACGEMFDWDKEAGMRGFVDRIWQKHISGEDTFAGGNIDKYSRRSLTEELVKIL